MSDIRIHTDQRAGNLAGRLGARAFTIGRDVYVKPELADATTPQGASLLAHELTHSIEQSGSLPISMPLVNGRGATTSGGATVVQRAADGAPASLPAAELSAESVERAVLRRSSGGPAQAGLSGGAAPDAEAIAEQVYRMLAEEIALDSERGSYLY